VLCFAVWGQSPPLPLIFGSAIKQKHLLFPDFYLNHFAEEVDTDFFNGNLHSKQIYSYYCLWLNWNWEQTLWH